MKKLLLVALLLTATAFAQQQQPQQQTTAFAQSQQIQLIDWFAGVDFVGITHSNQKFKDIMTVREFELSAMSRIDQNWNAVLTLSAHRESEEAAEMDIHEAFAQSNNIFEKTNLKIGKFFLGFGRLNRFHRHDWIFTQAPLYHETFFGSEGVKDTGFEYSRVFGEDTYYGITAGITAGYEFIHEHGHEEEEGNKQPHLPTHYLRFSSFKEFSSTKGIEYALNYVGRKDHEGVMYNYGGLDLTYKNRKARVLHYLIQSEVWMRRMDNDEEVHRDIGGYLYIQHGYDQFHAMGIRFDYMAHVDIHDEEEEEEGHDHGVEIDEKSFAVSLDYTYTNSEFFKTRFTFQHLNGLKAEEYGGSGVDNKFMVQFTFNVGSHPAHMF